MGFLRAILIFILVVYLGGLITRYVFPLLLRRYVRKRTGNDKRYRQNDKQKKEGEVTIDYQPEKSKKIKKNKGEYIDYEDVNED